MAREEPARVPFAQRLRGVLGRHASHQHEHMLEPIGYFFVPVFFVVVRRFFKAPPFKPADDTPALSNAREGQA